MFIIKAMFFLSGFVIFWAMIGYGMSIKILNKVYHKRKLVKDYLIKPTVTIMIVVHNEEKVILDKLKNVIDLKYPKDKIEFLISSDNSTDKTNNIIKKFIKDNTDYKIKLYEVNERKGKTNAQNEAKKTVSTKFIVMTDANSMLDVNAIDELMAAFTSDDIAYVAGRLVIKNKNDSEISSMESKYWDNDTAIREIESRIQTITAGNGALYACRTNEYFDFQPIQCHDSAMPVHYALNGKRAICNHDAIVYEKAGEVIEDEFKRKVRMNRTIIKHIIPDLRIFNVFKYKWFSYFYFGHRTCRYLLWLSHLILLVLNMVLINEDGFYLMELCIQVLFYLMAVVKLVFRLNNKMMNFICYYFMTIIAQWVGVYNMLMGRSKAFWEKAESTR